MLSQTDSLGRLSPSESCRRMSEPERDPDPEEFLRALLAIKPEDAKEVRDQAGEKAEPNK